MYKNFSLKTLARFMNFWPPYLGAGVRIRLIDEDKIIFKVSMPLHFYNRNYVGVHFGGSLYSMVDPFLMLILMRKLGPKFIVWDKEASIKFKRPGQSKVTAIFDIPEDRVSEIKKEVESRGKYEPVFFIDIKNEKGEVVAKVEKKLWVKKKD